MTMTTPQPQASAQVFGDLLMPTSLPLSPHLISHPTFLHSYVNIGKHGLFALIVYD